MLTQLIYAFYDQNESIFYMFTGSRFIVLFSKAGNINLLLYVTLECRLPIPINTVIFVVWSSDIGPILWEEFCEIQRQ